ncbi:MAG: xylulokinase [Vicinamibacteria bacterium]
MYFLGYDLGSSSVKACLFDGKTGRAVARSSHPDEEMRIAAPRPGWAEQDPELWWESATRATERLLWSVPLNPADVGGIGISYQMHGLVLVGDKGQVLRPSIIWCDSRAVDIGNHAFHALGEAKCLRHLLNSPANFTASKLHWVFREEPEIFARIHKIFLPGDYFAFRLTGAPTTTLSGLSEGIFWDFAENGVARFLLDHYEIPERLLPDRVATFGEQGRLTSAAASALGLTAGIPVTYRAGDQPTNALSLNVLEPGEIAATAGTSGVVYGVTDVARADPQSRVGSFAHVNHATDRTRLGVLLCINGTGSANRWLRQSLGKSGYEELNRLAGRAPVGSEGLAFYPFGNGAERMLSNRDPGASFQGLRFNSHTEAHLARAVQEGVTFSFRYGIGIVEELGLHPTVMRAGLGNMLLSSVFREALAGSTGCSLELYRTDGAEGAARGAAFGSEFYGTPAEAFRSLEREALVEPDPELTPRYQEAYARWAEGLDGLLG